MSCTHDRIAFEQPQTESARELLLTCGAAAMCRDCGETVWITSYSGTEGVKHWQVDEPAGNTATLDQEIQ